MGRKDAAAMILLFLMLRCDEWRILRKAVGRVIFLTDGKYFTNYFPALVDKCTNLDFDPSVGKKANLGPNSTSIFTQSMIELAVY